jgi:hypothetical protein
MQCDEEFYFQAQVAVAEIDSSAKIYVWRNNPESPLA